LARQPTIHIVCSDRHRNGKTLLARVLVDYLLLEGSDPYVLDADAPEGPLRAIFPGRTALVDLADVRGQMKLFDTILASPGRDYVIDLPATGTPLFCEAAAELDFCAEAHRQGFAIVVLFVIDKDPESVTSAANVQDILRPDIFVPVRNALVGSAYRASPRDLVIDMPALDRELAAITGSRRFSFRSFLMGDETGIPRELRPKLKDFLGRIVAGLRDIAPAISIAGLRSAPQRSS
jgi:hypothetical protein